MLTFMMAQAATSYYPEGYTKYRGRDLSLTDITHTAIFMQEDGQKPVLLAYATSNPYGGSPDLQPGGLFTQSGEDAQQLFKAWENPSTIDGHSPTDEQSAALPAGFPNRDHTAWHRHTETTLSGMLSPDSKWRRIASLFGRAA